MKVVFVLGFLVFSVSATQWKVIESPMDSPMYDEIVDKLRGAPINDDKGITGRITNGNQARLGDFPYQVFMYLTSGDGSRWLCGGSVKLFNSKSFESILN